MRRDALHLLKKVARRGEVSLATAIRMGASHYGDHRDQYPLALLLEAGYLGATLNHTPPDGAEEMREFSRAISLHMFGLPRDERGVVEYLQVRSTGFIDPANQRVFLKAKGALYLDDHVQRFWDRLWSFILGLTAGLLTAIAAAWLKSLLKLG